MHLRTWLATTLALLATLGAGRAASASGAHSAQDDALAALAGEWLYVEDRTEGRASEDQQPPMSVTFALRVEADAVVMVRGKGTERREERITLDGSTVEVAGTSTTKRSTGTWKDGALEHQTEILSVSDDSRIALIRQVFRITPDGLSVRVVVGEPAELDSLALYRHPQDIALPAPARAAMADMAWLAGAWTGTRSSASIEERWSPPLGGAMLGTSRTVSKGRMVGFEFLRIVERDGGLVYVAQPGGAPPTEFVLTELGTTRAVFENPRHDSPQRIVYELSSEGSLSASIGFIKGGRPQHFEFTREGD
ncbi:MAG: DUF6265 family protein [Planctomycetota bacterium]